MRSVSVVIPYYNNPGMLGAQYREFASYGDDVKKHLELVVVDDGSGVPIAPPRTIAEARESLQKHEQQQIRDTAALLGYTLQLFRIGVDVRWNQDGARNTGVYEATKEWVLCTDIDHLIPEETLRYVMSANLIPGRVYKFSRVEFDRKTPYKVHPNSWLMEKKTYDAAGGYDERFAGYYGTDWDFRDRVLRQCSTIMQLPVSLIRVGREHIADASCPREFGRKSPEDAAAIQRIKREREKVKGWKPLRLQQKYERVV